MSMSHKQLDFPNINNPKPLLVISDDKLMDYIKCPDFFYWKYLSKIPFKTKPSFSDLIKQVIDTYMVRLLNGKILTIQEAKRQWDKIIDNEGSRLNEKQILDGLGIINQLDRYCRNNKLIVADINSPYQLNFTENVAVTGKIGTIRYNNDKLELFVVETSRNLPNQIILDMSLKYTLQAYAISKLANNYNLNGIRIYHIKSGSEFTTYRTQKDFDRLEKTVKNISKAIRENIFYPREDFTCYQCCYKNYCGYN